MQSASMTVHMAIFPCSRGRTGADYKGNGALGLVVGDGLPVSLDARRRMAWVGAVADVPFYALPEVSASSTSSLGILPAGRRLAAA